MPHVAGKNGLDLRTPCGLFESESSHIEASQIKRHAGEPFSDKLGQSLSVERAYLLLSRF